MAFFGTVPTACIQQVLSVTPFETWGSAYVCCSGSFRTEQALRQCHPDLGVYSNDVSLWSSAIGKVAAGHDFDAKFVDRLAYVQDFLGDNATSLDRAAAVIVAQEASRYAGKNDYAKRHMAYFEQNFEQLHGQARLKLSILSEKLRLDGYLAGDWRTHVDTAIEQGAGIVAFPPFFKGDYENQYKFIDTNTQWSAPTYDLYDGGFSTCGLA